MRKMIVLLIVLFALRECARGQTTFGVKAGVNLCDQFRKVGLPGATAKHTQTTKDLLGYEVGIFRKIAFNSTLTLAIEPSFAMIGSKTPYITEADIMNGDSATHYCNDNVAYLDVPVTLQYRFNKLYVGIGPGIGFKLFSNVTKLEKDAIHTSYYKGIDVAGNVVAGYTIVKHLDVNLRYSYG